MFFVEQHTHTFPFLLCFVRFGVSSLNWGSLSLITLWFEKNLGKFFSKKFQGDALMICFYLYYCIYAKRPNSWDITI